MVVLAVEETGRGVVEDKAIKSMLATEHIYRALKISVGIVETTWKATWSG